MRKRIKQTRQLCVRCSSETYIKLKHDEVRRTRTTKVEVRNFGHYRMFGNIVTIKSIEEYTYVRKANIEIF